MSAATSAKESKRAKRMSWSRPRSRAAPFRQRSRQARAADCRGIPLRHRRSGGQAMTLWDVLKSDTNQVAYKVEEFRVRRMIEKGKLSPNDSVRRSGDTAWIRIADLPQSAWLDPMPSAKDRRKLRRRLPPRPSHHPIRRSLRHSSPKLRRLPIRWHIPFPSSCPPVNGMGRTWRGWRLAKSFRVPRVIRLADRACKLRRFAKPSQSSSTLPRR